MWVTQAYLNKFTPDNLAYQKELEENFKNNGEHRFHAKNGAQLCMTHVDLSHPSTNESILKFVRFPLFSAPLQKEKAPRSVSAGPKKVLLLISAVCLLVKGLLNMACLHSDSGGEEE